MILVLLLLAAHGCTSFDPRRHLSTKTPYALRPRFGSQVKKSGNHSETVFLTGVIRHGTRWPTKKNLLKYNPLKSFQKSVFPWESAMSRAGELHKSGQFEMHGLGQRLRRKFPSVFSLPYLTLNYLFMATGKTRTSASAIAFGMGAFQELCDTTGVCLPQAIGLKQQPLESDTLLRFYDIDQSYQDFQTQIKHNLEVEFSSTVYKAIAKRNPKLNKFLNNASRIGDWWDVCQMEASLLDINELRFCQYFTKHDFKLLEWSLDFEKFMRSGNGYSINCCLALPLLKNLVTTLEDARQGSLEEGKLARLYFAHAETLLPLACLLGLDRVQTCSRSLISLLSELHIDEEILKDSEIIKKHSDVEIWRCGLLSPMGGNLLLTLHVDSVSKEYYVRLYWNEELLSGSWCSGEDECSIEEFKTNVYKLATEFGSCQCTSEINATCALHYQTDTS